MSIQCVERGFPGKTFIVSAACLLASLATAAFAAESYPQRAVRVLIPFPPAGAGDILGRMLTVRLTESMGQQFVNDNRPGGGQVIATELAARANPDGYTLFLASATHAINPALLKKLPYDSVKDFSFITLVADSPLLCVANPGLGASNLKELIAIAKSKPGRINYATSGPGTGGHLAVELIKFNAGIDMLHVPYKGAGPALTDVIGGQVQFMCTSPLAVLPHAKSGRLRAIAMTSAKRSRAAPDIPTVAEQGLADYQASLWYQMLAPAQTPAPVLQRLHAEITRVLKLPEFIEQLAAQGGEPLGGTPQEARKFTQAEIERWMNLIRKTNISAQ
jgi:tripartite-type tricarboxylate transporter receptor subunit TctC